MDGYEDRHDRDESVACFSLEKGELVGRERNVGGGGGGGGGGRRREEGGGGWKRRHRERKMVSLTGERRRGGRTSQAQMNH